MFLQERNWRRRCDLGARWQADPFIPEWMVPQPCIVDSFSMQRAPAFSFRNVVTHTVGDRAFRITRA